MSTVAQAKQGPAFFDQFRLLTRYPNFGLLWLGQVVSHLGDAFYSIALIWLVQDLTGSRALMGAISAVVSATALFGLVSGALVDRWDRRWTMLISDVLRGAVILSLPLLWLAGRMQVWHLFVVGAIMGLLTQFFQPAKQALIPQIVKSRDLTGANALSHLAFMLLTAAGYGLGGALLGLMSSVELFSFDAATFAASAITIWLIRLPKAQAAPPSPVAAENEDPTGGFGQLFADIGAGLRYMRSDALIATLIPVAIIANFVFAPLTVLLAAWARDVIQVGAQGYGLLEGSFMVGAVAGTLAVHSLATRFSQAKLMTWGVLGMGLPLILFALLPNLVIDAAMLAGIGVCNGVINILLITKLQQRVPDHMMGRLFGAFTGLSMLAMPLGIALGGLVADMVPLVYLFIVIGAAMALLGLSLFRLPVLAELDSISEVVS